MKKQGLYIPVVTPFDQKGAVNLEALSALTRTFIDAGAAGLVVCGTTGEYYALDDEEHASVLSCVAGIGKGRVSLVAGITEVSTRKAANRAREAAALGYDTLMMAPPPYALPNQAELEAHVASVAEASPLPIVLYNFPARVGVEIELDTLTRLARLPNIIGIKESSGNFSRALALIEAGLPDFEVVCGCDDQAADFLARGVRSWISGSANVFPAEQAAMLEAAKAADWDTLRRISSATYPVVQCMEAGSFNQKAKLGCRRHGIDAGSVRQPLLPLPQEERQTFEALLAAYEKRQRSA